MKNIFKKDKPLNHRRLPKLMNGQDDFSFRRSRTLTGSISPNVRSAAEDRTHLKSPRVKLQQLKNHRRGVVTALFISLAIAAGLSWLISQFVILPKEIVYSDNQSLQQQPPTENYLDEINNYFSAYPLQRLYFQLNQDELNRFMQAKYPEIGNIQLNNKYIGNYDIALGLRQPLLSWASGNEKVYVDSDGHAFTTNYFAVPDVSVEDESGIKLEQGGKVLTSGRFLKFIGRVVGKVNQAEGVKVSKVIIPGGVTRQVELRLENINYPIKTYIDRAPTAQASDLLNAVDYLKQQGITPEYLDVRIEGKAYYK